MSEVKAGIGGEHYQLYAERTGGESVVFFTCLLYTSDAADD